ncbi:hypothetical protein ACW0JT_16515 [Arthrobacter sp. SA17]
MKFGTKGTSRVAPAYIAVLTGITLALTACGGPQSTQDPLQMLEPARQQPLLIPTLR